LRPDIDGLTSGVSARYRRWGAESIHLWSRCHPAFQSRFNRPERWEHSFMIIKNTLATFAETLIIWTLETNS
jgi:hypothetical protein